MSALDKSPLNQNFQSPLNFKFFIKKAPYLTFFVQKTAIPEISLPATEYPNPFVVIPLPGDHITYDPFQLTFKVDEKLKNYVEMHDWLRSMGFPNNFEEYIYKTNRPKSDLTGLYSDLQLLVLSSSENPTFSVNFVDAFPIHLSSLDFNTTDPTVHFIEATVSFRYTSFYIETI